MEVNQNRHRRNANINKPQPKKRSRRLVRMNTSQTELLKSAKKSNCSKELRKSSCFFLEEAQNFEPDFEITLELIDNYLNLQWYNQALNELKYLDVYHNSQSFEIYLKVLYHNHLIISFYQIPFYLKKSTTSKI